ncbi:phage tail length tape measure family protein [Mesorhizobium sp. M1334]|uniref:phage tail length tape measure family protein n=1 Tax=Mesorhizobium sp. M1334 TaxID=2957084 RepID=UPI00333DD364
MNDIALSSLRVGAEIDSSKYKTGAADKVAADRAMVASAQAVGEAIAATETKISASGNVVSMLTRRYVEGQKEAQAFERDLRGLNRQLETGKVSVEQAATILVGMNQKLGINANASELAAKGQVQLAAAVGAANAQIEGQVTALAQAAVAHQAMIAAARADQQAENGRQIAVANQGKFNTVLGVQTTPSTGARSSASIFEAEFAHLDQMAQLRAQQAGALFADQFNSSVMANSGKSARASASVFEEAGAEADQMAARVAALRAELNPLAAAQDRVNAELAEYSALAARGAISADELAQAQAMARSRMAANQNGSGNHPAIANATYQFQDIAVTSAMGTSPMMIALQQGTQLGMAMETSLGGRGAAGAAKMLGSAVLGLFSPINLVAVGLTAVVAVGIQFGSKLLPQTKSLKDATEAQRKAVDELAEAYGMAGVKAEDFGKKSQAAAAAAARRENETLSEAAKATNRDTLDQLARFVVPGYHQSGSYQARSEFSDFAAPIADLSKGLQTAHPDFQTFERDTQAIVDKNPGLQGIRDKIMGIAEAAMSASGNLDGTAKVLDRINQIRLPEKGILPKGAAGDELAAMEISAKYRMQQQFNADQLSLDAKSPQELAAVARAHAAATVNSDETAGTRSTRIELAGKQALIEAEHALKEAQDQRKRSLDQTLASAKLDADLIGNTTAATEGLRMAFQLEQQVREEAARNNVAADEAEIARIKEKAAEYGKLRALQQARDTIHGQEIDLETQRAELGLIGENTLAHDRAIAVLKAEQEIRKLGIPLYGEEAEAIRRNTAELAALAEASAKAKLAADLNFEREQQFRSAQDQQIASRQQGAGLDVDLNSPAAQQMRDIARFADAKGLAVGFLTDFKSELLRNGGDVGKALGEAVLSALTASMDKSLANIFDRLATWFASWLTGQMPGAGGAGVGAAAASTVGTFANDNYAPGAVTRAPLAAAGGSALSMVGNYKAGVDPRLTDILNSAALQTPGYKVDAFSGYRPGDPRFHGRGLATDVNLTDLASGKSLGNYQDASSFRAYEEFAQNARKVQMAKYPELNDEFRWGGYFGGPKGKYGAMDQMHFDLGGGKVGMGGGSWAGGLNDNQRALFPGAESYGIGASANTATTALDKMSTNAITASQNLGGLGGSVTSAVDALTGGVGGKGGLASILEGLKPGNFTPDPGGFAAMLGIGAGTPAPAAGGGGGIFSMLLSFLPKLFGFADGTENAPEGWAWVGERGPELRKLRGGDVIRSHGRSMDMAANANMSASGGGRGQEVNLHVNVYGGSGDEHIRLLARQGAQQAIGDYHEAQASGGFGELQRRYNSQKA